MGTGREDRKANAALAGLGGTRRILVSDTMLAEYSDEEIEVVLAHELGAPRPRRHLERDRLRERADLAGFYLRARGCSARFAAPLGLQGVGDVAGLPLLLLAAGACSLRDACRLGARACRAPRTQRRPVRARADAQPGGVHFGDAPAGRAEPRRGAPVRIVQWLFYSHPPLARAHRRGASLRGTADVQR